MVPTAAEPNWAQRGGTVNDASCLSRTEVAGVVAVRNEKDVADVCAVNVFAAEEAGAGAGGVEGGDLGGGEGGDGVFAVCAG